MTSCSGPEACGKSGRVAPGWQQVPGISPANRGARRRFVVGLHTKCPTSLIDRRPPGICNRGSRSGDPATWQSLYSN